LFNRCARHEIRESRKARHFSTRVARLRDTTDALGEQKKKTKMAEGGNAASNASRASKVKKAKTAPKKAPETKTRCVREPGICTCTLDAVLAQCKSCIDNNPSWSCLTSSYSSTMQKLFQNPKAEESFRWMQSNNVQYDARNALRWAMRTDKFEIFKDIFNDNRAKYFPSPNVFPDFYTEFLINTGFISHSMVPYLEFIAKEGAAPTSNHLTTLINNWSTVHGADIVRWLIDNGIQVDRSHVESAIFCSNVSALRCFWKDVHSPLRQQEKFFAHQAAENIDFETIKFLLDEVEIQVSIPELLKDLRIAWENSAMIEDRRYDDPMGMEADYRRLRQYLLAKEGYSPERDRKRLHKILQLFEANKEAYSCADYLDMMKFLKHLHDETLD